MRSRRKKSKRKFERKILIRRANLEKSFNFGKFPSTLSLSGVQMQTLGTRLGTRRDKFDNFTRVEQITRQQIQRAQNIPPPSTKYNFTNEGTKLHPI